MNDEDANGTILVPAEIDVSGRSVPEELPGVGSQNLKDIIVNEGHRFVKDSFSLPYFYPAPILRARWSSRAS